jgi:hypothetical protein
VNSSANCSLMPQVSEPSTGSVALPKPRSNISFMAVTRTASLSALLRASSLVRPPCHQQPSGARAQVWRQVEPRLGF